MIDILKKYDEFFILNNSRGNLAEENVFEFTDKSSCLILSAPHATMSFANKKEKCADLYTGAIVKYLGQKNNVSTLIRKKFTPYRCMVSDYIAAHNLQEHYFLDIHGFNKDIDYDVCIGIGNWEADEYPYLCDILQIADKHNLKTIVNHPNYTGRYGLTGRYQNEFAKPNVIQLELKKYLRDFYNNPDIVKEITLPFLSEIINCYK